jgi:hypothetical protein
MWASMRRAPGEGGRAVEHVYRVACPLAQDPRPPASEDDEATQTTARQDVDHGSDLRPDWSSGASRRHTRRRPPHLGSGSGRDRGRREVPGEWRFRSAADPARHARAKSCRSTGNRVQSTVASPAKILLILAPTGSHPCGTRRSGVGPPRAGRERKINCRFPAHARRLHAGGEPTLLRRRLRRQTASQMIRSSSRPTP